jgi:endonuclease/exonuclease/phosphatase family metal-dependent hydrolase
LSVINLVGPPCALASAIAENRGNTEGVRIVSLNAWGGAMFESLAQWIPTVKVDVLCLQEVTRTSGLSGWTTFEDGERSLPQRADLFGDVCTLLPCHRATMSVSDSGPVTDMHRDLWHQDFGLGTYVSAELEVVDEHSRFVSGMYVAHHEWPIDNRPRVAHGIRVFDSTNQRNLTVVQFHGLRDPAGKHDTRARYAQTEELRTLIDSIRQPGDFTVVCGDMNLLPDSHFFDAFAELGLVDLVGRSDTRTSAYPKASRHANYMLVSDPGSVINFEALAQPEVSDHRALVLDL